MPPHNLTISIQRLSTLVEEAQVARSGVTLASEAVRRRRKELGDTLRHAERCSHPDDISASNAEIVKAEDELRDAVWREKFAAIKSEVAGGLSAKCLRHAREKIGFDRLPEFLREEIGR